MTKKKRHDKSKSERKDEVERKRDERARRAAFRKERRARDFYSLEDDENYVSFCNQLQAVGLKIKDIPGDGNCLFRSLSDQFEGDHNKHRAHRQESVDYMRKNKSDFEPFHLEESPFEEYLEDLAKDGTFAGNDAIVAFARNNEVDVIIHQFNNPRFVINGLHNPRNIQLHIAYHNGEHYSSLRRLDDQSEDPAYIKHLNGLKNYQKSESQKTNRKGKQTKNTQHAVTNSDRISKISSASAATEKSSATALNSPSVPQKSSELAKDNIPHTLQTCEVTEECSDIERNVIESTDCKDVNMVRTALQDNDFDFDSTVAYLMQLLSLQEVHFQELNKSDEIPRPAEASRKPCDQVLATSESTWEESRDKPEESRDKPEESRDKPVDSRDNPDESRQTSEQPCDTSNESSNISEESHGALKQNASKGIKKDPRTAATHQSNRQRKQQAKQDKKKRRQDEQKKQARETGQFVKDVGQVTI